MGYQVIGRTAKRIDFVAKEALQKQDNLKEKLKKLEELSNQNGTIFKNELQKFLGQNENKYFESAFKYEGTFTKDSPLLSFYFNENYDTNRSKKILKALIVTLSTRIAHLEKEKTKIENNITKTINNINGMLKEIKKHFPENNIDGGPFLPVNGSVELRNIGTVHHYCPHQIAIKMKYFIQRDEVTSDQISTHEKLTAYNSILRQNDLELKRINEDIEFIQKQKLEAIENLEALEKSLTPEFQSYFAAQLKV